MDSFGIFKLNKSYTWRHKVSKKEDFEQFRVEEVKDKEMFDSDEVSKCDDIDSFICCICLLLTKKPYVCLAKCNAILCSSWISSFKDTRCPLCRSEKGFKLSQDQAIVQDKSIILKWKYADCDAEIKMSEFTKHLQKCQYASFRCTSYPNCDVLLKRKDIHVHKNECGFVKIRCRHFHSHLVLRKDLIDHENNWEFKMIPCKGCKVNYYKSALKAHEENCKDYPISCDNWNLEIKRNWFYDHQKIWAKVIVNWIAFDSWKFNTTRDDIEKHQRQCEFVYDILQAKIAEMTENISAKNVLITNMNNQLNHKKFSLSNFFS